MKSTNHSVPHLPDLSFLYRFDVVWSTEDGHLLHDQVVAANRDEAVDIAEEIRDPGYFVKNVELVTQPVWTVFVDGSDGLMTTARVRALSAQEARQIISHDPHYPGPIYKVQRLH